MSRPKQTERNNKILEMYNQGMTHAKIAEVIGLSTVSVSSVLRSMPGYQRRMTKKANKTGLKEDREAMEEVGYLEMLDRFTRVVQQANECAADGVRVKYLRGRLKKVAPMFLTLIDS